MTEDTQEELVRYVPGICKGEKPEYEGYVEFKAMGFDERWALVEKYVDLLPLVMKLRESEGTALEIGMAAVQDRKILKLGGEAIRDAGVFVRSVDIKRLKDGKHFTTFEALGRAPTLYMTLFEIAFAVIKGADEGN